MDEGNILYGGVDKLNEIKKELVELYRYKDKNDDLVIELAKMEKNIKSLEKAATDEVQSTVKKRRAEIEEAYDKQLDKVKNNIKKIKDKRDKRKDKKISERIYDETASLREENRRLKLEKKTLFRQKGVPSFCNTGFYYALYYPGSFRDFLIILLTLLVTLLAIPCGIYFYLLPEGKTIYLVGIYIATVVIFGGLYLIIGNQTKDRYGDIIKQGKRLRQNIISNNKKIKAIKKSIKKDKDESTYGLEDFDAELVRLDKEAADIAEQKKEALITFENSTVQVISAEIKKQYEPKIEGLKAEYEKMKEEIKTGDEKVKALSLKIASEYEPYIGKDLITLDRIDSLINIIEAGNASNISEAVQFYRKSIG